MTSPAQLVAKTRRWTAGTATRSLAVLRHARLTVGLVGALWVIGVLTGSIRGGPSDALLARIGVGVGSLGEGRWWTPLTAALSSTGPVGYLIGSALVVLLCAPVEHRLGAARTAVLLGIGQVGGTLLAVGVVALGAAAGDPWAVELSAGLAVGPGPAAVGAALGFSCRLTALWRRRVRLVLVGALLMLVLYSGLLSDVLRLSAALVGLVLGPVLLGRPPRAVAASPSRSEGRILLAALVAVSAVGPVVAAFAQTPIGPLSVLRFVVLSPPPDAVTVQQICADPTAADACADLRARLRLDGTGPVLLSVVPVLLLLVAAEGLRRCRRFARWFAVVLNVALGAAGVVLAVDVASTPADRLMVFGGAAQTPLVSVVLPAMQPLLVAGVLLFARSPFTVAAPPGTYRRWALVVGAALVAVSAVYVVGGYLARGQFDRPPDLAALVADLPSRFLPPGYLGEAGSAFLPAGPVATVLFEWTGVVFWLVVAAGTLRTFLRSRAESVDSDAARARELLQAHGGSALSYMVTWPGNSYWFTPDERSALAYRVISSVALTTGDPFGVREARAEAVRGFSEFCRSRGWTPCLYSVTDEARRVTTELGWSSVQVAEETVLPLPGLVFTGKKWQDVRTALNKAAKVGITAEWITFSSAPLAITDQVRAISEEWVADKGMPEMGFTLGGLDELTDDEVRCLIAVDADRTVHGITSWLPVYRGGRTVGWTLDFMRRRGGGFRGVMEFLIASAAQSCRDEGAEFLSLSGAPLARLDRGEQFGGLQRLLDFAGRALEPVYGFQSLLAFKAKFQPVYRPLYMAYPDPVALPNIGNAIGRAYLPHLTTRQAARLARKLLR